MVRSRKLIYPAERMLLEKGDVSKGKLSFFALAVADTPLVPHSLFDLSLQTAASGVYLTHCDSWNLFS